VTSFLEGLDEGVNVWGRLVGGRAIVVDYLRTGQLQMVAFSVVGGAY
jgi:hypothetical protein